MLVSLSKLTVITQHKVPFVLRINFMNSIKGQSAHSDTNNKKYHHSCTQNSIQVFYKFLYSCKADGIKI